MPKFLLPFVIVAALLQRYEFFTKLPNFFAIILREIIETYKVITYSLWTFTFSES